jgi:hypothetical protein
MKGSFSNEKQHYEVRKIVAKTLQTQKSALLCAVLTANAMTLAKKDRDKEAELLKIKRQKSINKGIISVLLNTLLTCYSLSYPVYKLDVLA